MVQNSQNCSMLKNYLQERFRQFCDIMSVADINGGANMGVFSKGFIIRVVVIIVVVVVIGYFAKSNHESRFIGHAAQSLFDSVYHFFNSIFG